MFVVSDRRQRAVFEHCCCSLQSYTAHNGVEKRALSERRSRQYFEGDTIILPVTHTYGGLRYVRSYGIRLVWWQEIIVLINAPCLDDTMVVYSPRPPRARVRTHVCVLDMTPFLLRFPVFLNRRHDNDAERICDISVAPTAEEILCERSPYVPRNIPSTWFMMPHVKVGTSVFRSYFRHNALTPFGFEPACLSACVFGGYVTFPHRI